MKKQIAFWSSFLVISFFLDPYVSAMFQTIRNPFLDTIMLWFSSEMTLFFVLIVVSATFLYEERKKLAIPQIFLSFGLGFIVSVILKMMFTRIRPIGFITKTIGFSEWTFDIPDYSFPSSHSSTAFSVLPILDYSFRHIRFFWIFFSVMVAISRIYLNEHYLSDVVAGIIIGTIIGNRVMILEKEHGFVKTVFQKLRI